MISSFSFQNSKLENLKRFDEREREGKSRKIWGGGVWKV